MKVPRRELPSNILSIFCWGKSTGPIMSQSSKPINKQTVKIHCGHDCLVWEFTFIYAIQNKDYAFVPRCAWYNFIYMIMYMYNAQNVWWKTLLKLKHVIIMVLSTHNCDWNLNYYNTGTFFWIFTCWLKSRFLMPILFSTKPEAHMSLYLSPGKTDLFEPLPIIVCMC